MDTLLAELGPKGEPVCATQATCAAYLALRADIVQMLELRKRLQHRQAAEASQGGSEGRGRRAHKGKVNFQSCQRQSSGPHTLPADLVRYEYDILVENMGVNMAHHGLSAVQGVIGVVRLLRSCWVEVLHCVFSGGN